MIMTTVLCRVVGHYAGKRYEAQHWEHCRRGEPDGDLVINDYMWTDGNYSCDCNRVAILGIRPEDAPELYIIDAEHAQADAKCGHKVRLESVTPIGNSAIEPLILDEYL